MRVGYAYPRKLFQSANSRCRRLYSAEASPASKMRIKPEAGFRRAYVSFRGLIGCVVVAGTLLAAQFLAPCS
jgi:hypothetical protein